MATRRVPAGLYYSMFVAAVSLGIVSICWNLAAEEPPVAPILTHSTAGLCLLWALCAAIIPNILPPRFIASQRGQDLVAVLQMGAIATGVVAVAIMLYASTTETLYRTFLASYGKTFQLNIWPSGLWDLAMIASAIIIGWRQTGHRDLITALFWILVFGGLWRALEIPGFLQHTSSGFAHEVATKWFGLFMAWSALVIAAFTIGGGIRSRWQRRRACPAEPWLLLESGAVNVSLRYGLGFMAMVVLLLGCVYLLLPWTPPATWLAGSSMLVLAHRRWNTTLADVALGLITIGVLSAITLPFPRTTLFWTPEAWEEVLNQILLGLAIMTFFWFWLADVWKQQLDDGKPWTTAGRLIHPCERVGYLVGATGVLLSLQLSFWPTMPYVDNPEPTMWRWAWGLSANALLILALIFAALRSQRPTLAWLTLFAMASVFGFVIVRLPHSAFAEACHNYWPFLLACISILLLAAAVLVSHSKRWQPFFEPMYLIGVFLAPVTAIARIFMTPTLSPTSSMTIPSWVPAATFCCLAILYAFAAIVPGPRTFIAVSALCLGLTFRELRQTAEYHIIDPAFASAALAGAGAVLLAWVVEHRKPTRTIRVLKWAGGFVVLIAILAGLVSSCMQWQCRLSRFPEGEGHPGSSSAETDHDATDWSCLPGKKPGIRASNQQAHFVSRPEPD